MIKQVSSIILATAISFCAQAKVPQILINTCHSESEITGHQCWRLGVAYRNENNYTKSLEAFKRSCKFDYASGCSVVGHAYFYGQLGVKQNYKKAKSFYQKGCNLGEESICTMIKEVEAEQQ